MNPELNPTGNAIVRIGAAAAILGRHANTLRQYERKGLITPVARTGDPLPPNGHRYYRLKDIRRLAKTVGARLAPEGAARLALTRAAKQAEDRGRTVLLLVREIESMVILRQQIEAAAEARRTPGYPIPFFAVSCADEADVIVEIKNGSPLAIIVDVWALSLMAPDVLADKIRDAVMRGQATPLLVWITGPAPKMESVPSLSASSAADPVKLAAAIVDRALTHQPQPPTDSGAALDTTQGADVG